MNTHFEKRIIYLSIFISLTFNGILIGSIYEFLSITYAIHSKLHHNSYFVYIVESNKNKTFKQLLKAKHKPIQHVRHKFESIESGKSLENHTTKQSMKNNISYHLSNKKISTQHTKIQKIEHVYTLKPNNTNLINNHENKNHKTIKILLNMKENTKYNKLNIEKFAVIYNWIRTHKYYPTEALFKDEEGKILIYFTIQKNSFIKFIKIKKASKYKSLNNASINMIKSSSPIPKFIIKESKITLPATFYINIIYTIKQ